MYLITDFPRSQHNLLYHLAHYEGRLLMLRLCSPVDRAKNTGKVMPRRGTIFNVLQASPGSYVVNQP